MPVRTESASLIPPPPINTQQPGVATTLLYSGSKFRGHQKSKGNSYDVEVVLQHVDMENSFLCGYLKIKGLTEEYPTLTTFFEGEIISRKHPFLTRKWDADEDVDRKHWGKFLAFYQYAKTFNSDEFDYEELKSSDFVFMRWKSRLQPLHDVDAMPASTCRCTAASLHDCDPETQDLKVSFVHKGCQHRTVSSP
ncbi:glucose-induced degradation protein 4 homolog isoform X2 [Chiloscyllium plagiosum]|uniref:glucose-induced degradation protein 4 homolog isoform X2 n=1 Tax=Chiloscyllium plagiosum TaxID=36176 RepID=UPI0009A34B7F|nr:glucose-induced degradation protein 4 homolog isoform X2 [Chiloscyllium plagiosum]XP_060696242.1 glucose-induced degradation protein 4 homolog isoform X2 [Hemiscyllium ocellatum]